MKKQTKKKTNKKQKPEVSHGYICEDCKKPATLAIQSWWYEYSIAANGDFIENNDWEGDTNEFYCDKHYPH